MTANSDAALAAYEAVLRPRPSRAWVGWACVAALATLAVFVWTVGHWFELAHIREFHAFELGLERACLAEHMTYTTGKCEPPEVQFSIVPFRAWPNGEPGSPLEAEPLNKKPKDRHSL